MKRDSLLGEEKMKKILLLVALFLISLGGVYAADWTRIEYSNGTNNGITVSDWDGLDKYATGWSLWSTTKPTNVGQYAIAKVYLKPNFGNEACSTSEKSEVKESYSNSVLVVKKNRSYKTYNDDENVSYCPNETPTGRGKNGNYGCNTKLCDNNGDATGYCTSPSNYWCTCTGCSSKCGTTEAKAAGHTANCYFINCPETVEKRECNSDEVSEDTDCGVHATYHCYQTATSYPTATPVYSTTSLNWHKTLADAGGYARVVYIYSYPQRVFIRYNGNGSNGTCTSRPASTYKDPTICTAYGSENLMSDSYISYYDTEPSPEGVYNLSNNLFYRTGYDFLGWSTNPNATTATYGNQESVRIAKAGVSHTQKEIVANAGDTVTLYAIWKRHDYKITYVYYCGNANALTKKYNYEIGLTLQSLNVADGQKDSSHEACDTNSKSYYDETNSNTKFENWYTDSNYVNKITTIPDTWHEDITLYAKLSQRRTYDYVNNRWKYE